MVARSSVITTAGAAAAHAADAVVMPGRRLLVPVLSLLLLLDLPKSALVSAFEIEDLSSDCVVSQLKYINDGYCDGGEYNSEECSYDGEDCDEINAEFVQSYPDCEIPRPDQVKIQDGYCDPEYNMEDCLFDGGDCNHSNLMVESYPDCPFELLELVRNGYCDVGQYNTPECGYDGGDCYEINEAHKLKYPDCKVTNPILINNMFCNGINDGEDYNTEECDWDGGDCVEFNEMYPNCNVPSPERLNNTSCNDGVEGYNTEECGWDGGDCDTYNSLPACTVEAGDSANLIGDGQCDCKYNTTECDFDAGDCKYDKDDVAQCSCEEENCS